MTEQDWEEFKRNVIPIKKKTYSRKRVTKNLLLKKKKIKQNLRHNFFMAKMMRKTFLKRIL